MLNHVSVIIDAEEFGAEAFIKRFEHEKLTQRIAREYIAAKKQLSPADKETVRNYFDEWPIVLAAGLYIKDEN